MKSSTNDAVWSVGQVAERFDLPTNVLRHWETVGLLTPERDSADRRRYGPDDVRRAAVQRSKDAGLSSPQTTTKLDTYWAGGRQEVAEQNAETNHNTKETRGD